MALFPAAWVRLLFASRLKSKNLTSEKVDAGLNSILMVSLLREIMQECGIGLGSQMLQLHLYVY